MNRYSPLNIDRFINPVRLLQEAAQYATDAWQRSILYADIARQRGNQYRAHMQESIPNVLSFPAEVILSGLDLPDPVNYGLVRILPSADQPTDESKRPFIIVDPRAGHGPGIGGFKPDSEIGAALQAGHPCYFVGFLPMPVPGQTIEHVLAAQAAFVRAVHERHSDSEGKPAVIANCQAGWQTLMAAALWPELFGPLILAGSPVSYWAGETPMRYAGGLLGGSWLTALSSDIGHGHFDGAWLVQNFENLNPANTIWTKQYNVYAKVDTEGPRYLEFEKYWGGLVYLEDKEIQYIVDNLFIGNKLSSGELSTSSGQRIDLRNIRSPIVVFCSYGDNITPPAQALGWITDLYQTQEDLLGHDQTIVYATHENIGHLGIFVSSNVGRKEHRKFAANIDIIDTLPAGLFHATIDPYQASDGPSDFQDPFLLSIHRSTLDDIKDIVKPNPSSDRAFAAAAKVSNINLALYRQFLQPWVKTYSTKESAQLLSSLHPLRLGFSVWSDKHPYASAVAASAEQVKKHRVASDTSNPFWQLQELYSNYLIKSLDLYRDCRDAVYEASFYSIYGSPFIQAIAGFSGDEQQPARPHPCNTLGHKHHIQTELAKFATQQTSGGLSEALARSLSYIFYERGEADERHFQHAWEAIEPYMSAATHSGRLRQFRALMREQALLLHHDLPASLAGIPTLLAKADKQQVQSARELLNDISQRGEQLSVTEQDYVQHILHYFDQALASTKPDQQASK